MQTIVKLLGRDAVKLLGEYIPPFPPPPPPRVSAPLTAKRFLGSECSVNSNITQAYWCHFSIHSLIFRPTKFIVHSSSLLYVLYRYSVARNNPCNFVSSFIDVEVYFISRRLLRLLLQCCLLNSIRKILFCLPANAHY